MEVANFVVEEAFHSTFPLLFELQEHCPVI